MNERSVWVDSKGEVALEMAQVSEQAEDTRESVREDTRQETKTDTVSDRIQRAVRAREAGKKARRGKSHTLHSRRFTRT